MRKYAYLGLIIVVLGVCGALIWNAGAGSCGRRDGMRGKCVSAESLVQWPHESEQTLVSTEKDRFYLQESIGSLGARLTSPNPLEKDFVVSLEVMSVTRRAVITFMTSNRDGSEEYVLEIHQQPGQSKINLRRGAVPLVQKYIADIEPDRFYKLEIRKKGEDIRIRFGDKTVAAFTDREPIGRAHLVISLLGLPDNPGGIYIKDLCLFQ